MNVVEKSSLHQIEIIEEAWNLLNITMKKIFNKYGIILESYCKGDDKISILFDVNKIKEDSIVARYKLSGMQYISSRYVHFPIIKLLGDDKLCYDALNELEETNHISTCMDRIFISSELIKYICFIINIEVHSEPIYNIIAKISKIKKIDDIIYKLEKYGNHTEYLKYFKILQKNKNIKEIIEINMKIFNLELKNITKLFHENTDENLKERHELMLVKIQEQKEEIKYFDMEETIIRNSNLRKNEQNMLIHEVDLKKNKEKKVLENMYNELTIINNNINFFRTECNLKKTKNSLLDLQTRVISLYLNKEFLLSVLEFEKTLFPEMFIFSKDKIEKDEHITLLNQHYIYYAQKLGSIICEDTSMLQLVCEIKNVMDSFDNYHK